MNTNRKKDMVRGLTLVVLMAMVCLAGSTPVQGEPEVEAILDKVDAYILAEMKRAPMPGLAVGIVHGDQVVYLKGFGVAGPDEQPVTPQTPFDIGSIGKCFTALALHQLAVAGKLELEAPVQRYLPGWRLADPEASARITLRHLIDQTSGIPWAEGTRGYLLDPENSLADIVHQTASIRLNRPVGERFEYSNINYLIAGRVIEVVSGQPFAEYIQEHILQPLEMTHSHLSQPEAVRDGMATGYRTWFGFPVPEPVAIPPGMLPAGHLMVSAEDMTHVLVAYLNDGLYNGANLVLPGAPASAGLLADTQAYYDLHWDVQPGPSTNISIGQSGGSVNFNSDLQLLPGKHWGAIVLINARPDILVPAVSAASMANGIAYLLQGWEPEPFSGANFYLAYVLIDLSLIVLAVFIVWQVGSVISAGRRGEQSVRRAGPGEMIVTGLDLLLGLAILLAIPTLVGLSWPDLRADFPDVGNVLWLEAAALLLVGLVRMGIRLGNRITRHRQMAYPNSPFPVERK